ncbi:hypothetical protein ACFVKB_36080 [Rhodococcus sp. NPDC127530]|uniref:hypothetical protein n=1 Tax=unclassified Rhodococcus (in: high G+C Gram-positive bacteria) TaxID=192944 RepID=UPI0036336768
MTGWGQTGPKATTAGHDVGHLAGTGLLHAIGDEEHPQIPLAQLSATSASVQYIS